MVRLISFSSLLLLFALVLTGCSGKYVRVAEDQEFNTMAKRLAPVLRDRGVIDAKGAYISPLFGTSSLPPQVGGYLLQRLSPAFRFQVDPSLLPPTFAASRSHGDTLEMRPHGFVLSQGSDIVTVSLLAETDWNNDKSDDWLLLCRVKSTHNNGLLDYYLVIEKPFAKILHPRLLAVYDCRSKACKLFVDVAAKKALPAYTPEIPVIEVEAGQHDVTLPPGTPPPSGTPADPIKEQKLGQ
ncbi:MAG: motor neuron and pancreas homeobox protein 1 [Bilophila sp.]